MAARSNPNWYRRANRASRTATSQRRYKSRKSLRAKYRRQGGANWYKKSALRKRYEAEASKGGVSAKALLRYVTSGRAGKTTATRRKAMYSRRKKVAGKFGTWGKSKSKAYNFGPFRRDAKGRFKPGRRKVIRRANARRLSIRRRSSIAKDFRIINATTGKGKWKDGYKGVKVSGYILEHMPKRKRKRKSTKRRRPTRRKATKRRAAPKRRRSTAKRRRPTRRKSTAGRKRRPSAYNKFVGAYMRKGHSMKQAAHAWRLGNRKAVSNRGRRRARRNYGALALKNRGFGALALKNGLALDNGVTVAGVQDNVMKGLKFAGSGVAGMMAFQYVSPVVEDLVAKVPVVGDFALDLTIPEMVPVIGGASLSNSVVGIIGGAALGTLSLLVARFSGIREIGEYGLLFSGGMAVIGGALDTQEFFQGGGDLGALALDNYGALALDNYGDGMAYQLGALALKNAGAEFSQSSLADAYYSGADFSLGEGQALLNGKHGYMRRFGRPAHRVARHGGSTQGPSHMAGKPGHRWGWLVKMLGWEAASQVARQSPSQRIKTIAALRANALATLKQMQETAQIEQIASPEFTPLHSQAPIPHSAVAQYAHTGAQGVGSSYGSTIFAGQGL